MMNRRYNYDVRRATNRETLPKMLKRCKVEVEPTRRGERLMLPATADGIFTIDESEILARLTIKDMTVTVALNLRNRLADFDAYGTLDGPLVVLYPDHLLPQAEDAYNLYIKGLVTEGSVYTDSHCNLLDAARKFIANKKKKEPLVWLFDGTALPLLIGTGLEDIDYSKWRRLSRQRYIEECIIDRATTYLTGKLFGIAALRLGMAKEQASEIGKLSEIAYGPIPLARLGEYIIIEYEIFCKILVKAGFFEDIEVLRLEKDQIIAAARAVINLETRASLGRDFEDVFDMRTVLEIKNAIRDITPLYLEEPREEIRLEEPKVVQLRIATAAPAPILERPAEVVCINKLDLEKFITKFKRYFIGDPTEILTALHDIAKIKEIRYTMDHQENLVGLIEKYRHELKARYFDVNSALDEITRKSAKLAARTA